MEFVKLVDSYGLFEQKSVNFTPRDQNGVEGPQQKIADYWAVSEEKLNQLPADKFQELRDNGAIGAIYAHILSLLNWQRVIQRALRTPPPGQPLSYTAAGDAATTSSGAQRQLCALRRFGNKINRWGIVPHKRARALSC